MRIKETILRGLDVAGLQVFQPLVRLAAGEDPKEQVRSIVLFLVIPMLAFGLFLLLWAGVAKSIVTKFGTLPSPTEVWVQAEQLVDAHYTRKAEADAFDLKQEQRAISYERYAASLQPTVASAASPDEKAKITAEINNVMQRVKEARAKRYSAGPSYLDQIVTSLKTVFTGFVVASLIAIPIGILCGLSAVFLAALNPLIQIFKPVSPLAWLPIVMIVVGAVYTTEPSEAWFEKSFLTSAFTVALCSLWPTLVNTALGVASIDKDHLNVAKVLQLPLGTRIRKIVIPSALPYMFAGLRISLGVGWMVLIAAEMLAQNPGLGKFVWDMFQNGSSQTLAQIMVAVFTIGIIGFLLDRVMIIFQRAVSYDRNAVT